MSAIPRLPLELLVVPVLRWKRLFLFLKKGRCWSGSRRSMLPLFFSLLSVLYLLPYRKSGVRRLPPPAAVHGGSGGRRIFLLSSSLFRILLQLERRCKRGIELTCLYTLRCSGYFSPSIISTRKSVATAVYSKLFSPFTFLHLFCPSLSRKDNRNSPVSLHPSLPPPPALWVSRLRRCVGPDRRRGGHLAAMGENNKSVSKYLSP